ncbi:hypothetical protein LXA43DRAFT_1066177 [Ganoderma leucocontextum]|nr:hypothetical protein LXA43DRAFT_1066177 [Ganoderma leucocontextum]
MTKFNELLTILAVARFNELLPFAIGCVWENNRRVHTNNPDDHEEFDPERVRSADTPSHPAYIGPYALRFSAALKGPMALLPELRVRDHWWPEPEPGESSTWRQYSSLLIVWLSLRDLTGGAAVLGSDGGAVPSEGRSMHERGRDGGDEAMVVGEGLALGSSTGGDGGDGESEIEADDEERTTGSTMASRGHKGKSVARASRGARGAGSHRTTRATSRPPQAPVHTGESDMEVDQEGKGAGTGGRRSSAKGKSKAGVSQPSDGDSTRAAAASVAPSEHAAPASGSVESGVKTKHQRRPNGKLTLYDLEAEKIKSEYIPHPRPCKRCHDSNQPCTFNPILRPYCQSCEKKRAKCSNAFNIKEDHCMATYLGYAVYRMVSNPSVYAEPTFSPSNLPQPLPADIQWFRDLYAEVPRGRTGRMRAKNSTKATGAVTVGGVFNASIEDSATGGGQDVQQRVPSSSGRGTSVTTRSTSMSRAQSPASITLPGSSAASGDEPPASPSGFSGTTDHVLPGADEIAEMPGSPSTRPESVASSRAMSLEDETAASDVEWEAAGEPASWTGMETGAVAAIPVVNARIPHIIGSDGVGITLRTREQSSIPSGRRVVELKVRGSELERRSSARRPPPDLPPPPPGAERRLKAANAVPRLQGSWTDLPRLGRCLGPGVYEIVPPPHEDDGHAAWRELADLGMDDLDVLRQPQGLSYGSPDRGSRPVTPDRQVFVFNDNIVSLAKTTKAKFAEMSALKDGLREDAILLGQQSDQVLQRSEWGPEAARAAGGDGNLLRLDDISSILLNLSNIHETLAQFAQAFDSVPAVPMNWTVLLDLLSRMNDMGVLYRTAWERFATLEEDVRPVRTEMQRIRYLLAHVQTRLDEVPNESIVACEPLIHNMYQQLESRLTHLDGGSWTTASLPRTATVGDVLQILTSLSERVAQLERTQAGTSAQRMEACISEYLEARGISDDVLRELATTFGQDARGPSAGSSISHALHTVYEPPSTGGNVPPPHGTAKFQPPLERMTNEGVPGGAATSASAPTGRARRTYGSNRAGASSSGVRHG